MPILEFVTIVSGSASTIGGVDVIRKHFTNSTPEDLFKKSFVDAVKQIAPNLADIADPKTIEVDHNTLDNIITSLKDIDITDLVSLEADKKLAKVTTLFRDCIILPGHQLTTRELLQRLQPVLERTFTNFYDRLPRNQQAANQMMLKSDRMQLEGQRHLGENIEIITDDNKEIKQTTLATLDEVREVNAQINVNITDLIKTEVAKEHHAEIDNARNLLKNHKPATAFELLETLKKRIWTNASEDLKFNILTNMAAAQFALNNEQETARLLLEAFRYKPEEEKALANRALAHLLLGEIEKATDYAEQTLQKNFDNADAYAILIESSTDEETLEEVIDKAPEHLRKTPQIAYAISCIAKQHGNLEEARKWRETMVAQEQGRHP